ncbi:MULTISPECIES: hypothetical protein [unclassified Streptomyces]|uniref:hypothetical protein n=1 Tax=unclassified Streptomyces TaxID=2593676 RepID=UPI00344C37FB
MDLTPYVTDIRHEFAAAAVAEDGEPCAAADRLGLALDASMCLTLLTVLSDVAAEITRELAPGSVSVRLNGLRPEFVFTPAPRGLAAPAGRHGDEPAPFAPQAPPAYAAEDDGGVCRINLRLPTPLKHRAEEAATQERLSLNGWLVRAITGALANGDPRSAHGAAGHVRRNGRTGGPVR